MNLTAAHPKDDCSIARHAHRGVWCHIDCTALLIGMTVTDYSTLDAQFAAFGTDGSAARRRTFLDHGLVLQRDQRTQCRAVVTRFNGSAAFHAGEVPYCTALKGKTAILDDDTVRLAGFTRINSAAVVTLIIIRLGLVVLNRQGTAALIDDLFPVWRQNMPVQIQLHIGSGLIDADRLFLVYQKMDRLALLRRVDGSLQGRIEEIAVRVGGRIIGTTFDPCYRFPCNILLQCRGQEMLRQFGIMGSVYMESILGVKNPRVVLANVGTEDHKGGPLQHKAFELLKTSGINFLGNTEARDIPAGVADVVVADGFTGNIIAKMYEGAAKELFGKIKGVFYKNLRTKIAALLIKKELMELKQYFDYNRYGGAVVLGVRKPVLKTHGSANAVAVSAVIRAAAEFAQSGAIDIIEKKISELKGEEDK